MSSIDIPDVVRERIAAEAIERGMTVDELAAEVLSERFGPARRRLSFAAAGSSSSGRAAAEAEQLLEEDGFGVDSADR